MIRELLAGEPGVMALGGGALESARTRDAGGAARPTSCGCGPASSVAWSRVKDSDRPARRPTASAFGRRARPARTDYREAANLEVDADGPVEEVPRARGGVGAARAAAEVGR